MSEKSQKKSFQRILILVSALAFFGSTAFGIVQMFANTKPSPQQTSTIETESIDEQLKEQENGYKLVLEREPENPVALQGLVKTRLEMNNLKGAIEPMEKLVELYPDQVEFKALLSAIKQQVSEAGEGSEVELQE